MTTYETKDSGVHQEYESGMRRDSQDGKPRFDLIRTKLQPYEEQMVYRYAMLLARGAAKYDARNWEDGCGQEELDRAKASLLRHTEQLVAGETDEDHAAAVWFNTQAIEYFRWRLQAKKRKRNGSAKRRRKAAAKVAATLTDSEINNLALQKATAMRRRERILAAAKELDQEFTQDAKDLAAQDGLNRVIRGLDEVRRTGALPHVHAPSVEMPEAKVDPIIDVNDDGSPVRESDLARNRRSGATGLYQFMSGSWAKPSFSVDSAGVTTSLKKLIEQQEQAFRLLTRHPAPSQISEDGETVTYQIQRGEDATVVTSDTEAGVDAGLSALASWPGAKYQKGDAVYVERGWFSLQPQALEGVIEAFLPKSIPGVGGTIHDQYLVKILSPWHKAWETVSVQGLYGRGVDQVHPFE